MDISELESFKLSDAVKFHNTLNKKLWKGDKLYPEVKDQLLLIAEDFIQYMGLHDLAVKDIAISGSNAAYSYTPHSDLDLHIVVDFNELPDSEVYAELFNAKKTLYNDSHDITIHDIPIELYVQDSNEPVVSLGEYSVLHDKWIKLPKKSRANFDQRATKAKFQALADFVEHALKSSNLDKIDKVIDIIKRYRKAGLSKGGEFSPENLAFKAIRNQGGIEQLYKLRDKLKSKKLSIEAQGLSNEDYHPNGPPPGPEFKPTMPKGTVRVDVSDVYDWYKLGQNISNLSKANPKMFGKGPPSTIMAFGSEDEEHKYIQALQKLGLDTTDIDPVDPKQPKGMKRQKVDPTYNVNEALDQPYKITWERGVHGDLDALATLDDGTYLLIMFDIEDARDNSWAVQFYRDGEQSITGEGDVYRIFATVLTAIQQFIKQKKPNKIFFAASKDQDPRGSRAKLYNRLVQKYAAGLGYDVRTSDMKHQTEFYLSKQDSETPANNVNEISNTTSNKLSSDYFFFDYGFDPNIKKFIKSLKIKDQSVSCQKETLRWAKLLTEKGLDVEIHHGFYYPNNDIDNPEGHTWLEVEGSIFDPTAGQFDDHGKGEYQTHETENLDGEQYLKQSMTEALGSLRMINKEVEGGNLEGYVVDTNKEQLGNYLESQGASPELAKKISQKYDRIGIIRNMWVDEEKRNQGLGTDLISNAVEDAFLNGAQAILLVSDQGESNEFNLTKWYQTFGFKKIGVAGNDPIMLLSKESITEASGYIPSKKQANDPRFKTALTVDVKPDSIKKNAKAFSWLISREGVPPEAKTNGKIS